MKAESTPLPGLIVFNPEFFHDSRGYFFESYNREKYEAFGLIADFVQDNLSKSIKNTVRGLHYQIGEFAQGKLCQVISGNVMDVAVDIRFGSPTFGMHFSVELSGENHRQIWIPPGFAHGFSVLSDEAVFSYKCSAKYDKPSERSILYNDVQLDINWMVDTPLVSEKDMSAMRFSEIEKDFFFI